MIAWRACNRTTPLPQVGLALDEVIQFYPTNFDVSHGFSSYSTVDVEVSDPLMNPVRTSDGCGHRYAVDS